ncbi:MAG: TetR/AcrR family transcriptional regulator [Gammaproteobacteria bacterium]|nr:TetR/AcrR family transcriptional regulator [Gammaproteobacteria bacterium]MDH5731623.1 TetR/AcrR family transcriptional regulator [Gammaproteobacteria bacterium]
MKKANTLTPEDWIKAGFRALVSGGEQAIKAEAIAKSLNVSKGSFYWHFKDVSSLKEEMLKHWETVATHDIIFNLSTNSSAPLNNDQLSSKEQLRQLIEIVSSDASEPYGGVLAEPSIRSWARYNKDVAETLANVDKTRLAFVARLFESAGIPANQCALLSRLFYGSLIGLEQLSSNGAKPRVELHKLLDLIFQTNAKK